MDPFTQRLLEKAEQRSRALGISNTAVSKFADIDNKNSSSNINASSGACATTMASLQQQKSMHTFTSFDSSSAEKSKLHVIEKDAKETAGESQKVLRQFSAVDKENMDLGIEINIVTDKNVEVQVQVEEQDLTDDDLTENQSTPSGKVIAHPTAKIRDTSRNRLQRLGALYSNTDDLSSPIHRTEGKFHAECDVDDFNSQVRKPKHQRLGKLAALANTINQWEDDTSHHGLANNAAVVQPPPKPELPSRDKLVKAKQISATNTEQRSNNKPTPIQRDNIKQLKWDSKVLNSLEAQGFQRRESSTVKVCYEFDKTKEYDIDDGTEEAACSAKSSDGDREGICSDAKKNTKKFLANNSETNAQMDKKISTVKSGLVSGRAAIFESQSQRVQQQQRQQKPQKDPTELPLKERMKLFEKNKGEALMPKAAFGMAPPKSKIFQENSKKEQLNAKTTSTANSDLTTKSNITSVVAPFVKSSADSKVREKATALVKATAENTVKEEIRKQREEDLQLLSNRFNKQKDFFNNQQPLQLPTDSKSKESAQKEWIPKLPPPPPPPLPVNVMNFTTKRRSPINTVVDDKKRQRTQHRLYPALSHIESTDSSDTDNANNWCTTASALSTADEMTAVAQPLCNSSNNVQNNIYDQRNDEDIEDSYMESEGEDSSVGIQNGSLGRQVMEVVQKNYRPEMRKSKGVHYADKDSYFENNTFETSTTSSDVSMCLDDYLDEALEEGDEDDTSQLSRDSKGTTTSNSFSFRKAIGAGTYEGSKNLSSATTTSSSPLTPVYKQPVKSELSVNKENENVTLVHTVSFYRRQQNANSASSTPIRKVCREEHLLRSALKKLETADGTTIHLSRTRHDTDNEAQSADSELDDSNLVEDKIKRLLEEVCKQQQVIAQASQALNLCAATIEFSGSTESVEGERHLLVATHRRQACLDEVQRLRVENTLRPSSVPCERGRLTVKEITIPLRQDYIRKLSLDTISGHHLVCLLKYNEHVLATKTVPTLPGLLSVKFPDVLQLNNVYADFKVTLEIYGMTAQREVLPHEVKYHINFNKKSGIKTPKKKGSENRLVMPPVQSPAGPHVVRTPALVQYGFAIFSLREIQRTSWTLTQVLGVSPLEGVVHMKVICELSVSVEYKGFLTMYEDISGFGAWHRRWCHLNGTVLNYWKYPDDERKKAPMGTIDLYTCSSPRINIAPRDICARLNTILLECRRSPKETDQETLIIVPNGSTTTVRYLLSADTKEEREEWCAFLNKTLTLLRAWGPASQ